MKRFAFALCLAAGPAVAQPTDFTTPEGAAFIHQSLGPTMLSFQNQGEIDRIYFSNLLAWRCGTASIMYGLNDEPPTTLFPAEPCYREFRELFGERQLLGLGLLLRRISKVQHTARRKGRKR